MKRYILLLWVMGLMSPNFAQSKNEKQSVSKEIIGIDTISQQTDTIGETIFTSGIKYGCPPQKYKGFFLYFPCDITILENKGFNNLLEKYGYPKWHIDATIGLAGQLYYRKWTVNSLFTFNSIEKEKENYYKNQSLTSFSLNFGYDFIDNFKYSIFPYAGIKMYHIKYSAMVDAKEPIRFEDYLGKKHQQINFTNKKNHLDLGVGFSFEFGKIYWASLRAGYLFPLQRTNIYTNNGNTQLMNSPDFNYKYYFTLGVGSGEFSSY